MSRFTITTGLLSLFLSVFALLPPSVAARAATSITARTGQDFYQGQRDGRSDHQSYSDPTFWEGDGSIFSVTPGQKESPDKEILSEAYRKYNAYLQSLGPSRRPSDKRYGY